MYIQTPINNNLLKSVQGHSIKNIYSILKMFSPQVSFNSQLFNQFLNMATSPDLFTTPTFSIPCFGLILLVMFWNSGPPRWVWIPDKYMSEGLVWLVVFHWPEWCTPPPDLEATVQTSFCLPWCFLSDPLVITTEWKHSEKVGNIVPPYYFLNIDKHSVYILIVLLWSFWITRMQIKFVINIFLFQSKYKQPISKT